MEIVQQVQKRMLVSLAQIAKEIDLKEGDYILIEKKDEGILLRPVEWVDKSQKYFWTEVWQDKIKSSQQALENGEYQTFESMEEAIKDLEELAHASGNKD